MASWEAVAKESEDILQKPDIKGCYEYLLKAYNDGQTHPEILWRLARAHYELAEETTDAGVRDPLLKKGLELAEKAVQEAPDNFATHKWLGVLISEQNVSTKEKIANAYVIRDHFLKAIELNPHDATSQHCMGSWCWSILQIGWMERKAAALLFGEPPSSTYEDCLKYLMASDKEGATIHNACLIGDVHQQQKQHAEAKEWYSKAAAMPVKTEREQRNHDEAAKKLKKC